MCTEIWIIEILSLSLCIINANTTLKYNFSCIELKINLAKMDKENLRKQISKTFFSYETEYGKKCIDEIMSLIDKHVEQQLKLYGVVNCKRINN